MIRDWMPELGAQPIDGGTRFAVYAPEAREVTVRIGDRDEQALARDDRGVFTLTCDDAPASTRYRYRVDGGEPWPDPWSRWQPDGVHGPSQVVDPRTYQWLDDGWQGMPRGHLVFYELHVGTFTPEGTFAAAAERLAWLRDLGVTAVEVMPVAAFPGSRNWGYDGAALFAPSEHYGHPDDLRRFVDRAHRLGLAVFLDVVYNHLGPDGAYLAAFVPNVLTDRHPSAWGMGIDLDGPHSALVRRTFIDNGLHWLNEYHLDGLRLDATHALVDDSPEHWLAEFAGEVERLFGTARQIHLVAEDERNLARLVLPRHDGGYGLDALWADDFHHAVRRRVAGDDEGYYADYRGTTAEIATALNTGWIYTGQYSAHRKGPRGGPADGVPPPACVICIQNHDQVGNRAFGERLHHEVDEATWLAISTLLLMAPQTPLLFMGQEWAARSPFLFFTDHAPALGQLVTHGRRDEFQAFAAFNDALVRETIPDPQAAQTWRSSTLDWSEPAQDPHARLVATYRHLLALRRALLFDAPRDRSHTQADAPGDDTVRLVQTAADGRPVVTLLSLGHGPVRIPVPGQAAWPWQIVFDTRAGDVLPSRLESASADAPALVLAEAPCAVVLRPAKGAGA
jgi:maltooligosyltrehalose trehalohydrolase